MITKLGTHKGYAVVRQESEGHEWLAAVADSGRGQWDDTMLLGAQTFEQAVPLIDAWLAQQDTIEEEGDYDIDEEVRKLNEAMSPEQRRRYSSFESL